MAEFDARAIGLLGPSSARASRAYRLLCKGVRLIGRGVFGFRTEVRGRAALPRGPDGRPAGGWIAAGLPHRTWVDPFVLVDNLPVEPRLIFFGDGPAMFRSPWRRWVVQRIGGVIPIWPGGNRQAVEAYIAAARVALDAGAVLCLFPETGPPTPPGTARPFGAGLAYFALRTGAPIVPLVLGGTEDLYRRRRFRLHVQGSLTWQDLAGVEPGTPPPPPWSSAERRTAHRVTLALHERMVDAVMEAHRAATPAPDVRKRWRWLTTAWH